MATCGIYGQVIHFDMQLLLAVYLSTTPTGQAGARRQRHG